MSNTCLGYCYYDGTSYEGGDTFYYSVYASLLARRWVYELAIEYASYDDLVAIPFDDLTNDNYWIGYYGRNAKFDPFIQNIPGDGTVEDARQLDDTLWPYRQYSETGKRMAALAIILASRKEATIYKYYKNPNITNIRDWPQPPASFNVDRRPGVAISVPIAGGERPDLLNWSSDYNSSTSYWKKCLELNTDGSFDIIANTGAYKFLQDYFEWNYNRGLRRFMLWVPCGTMHYTYIDNDFMAAYTSAITSSMQKPIYEKIEVQENGSYTVSARYVNPSEACWIGVDTIRTMSGGGTLNIPTLSEADTIPDCNSSDYTGTGPCFNSNGRLLELTTLLKDWITNKNSSSNIDDHVDVGLYIGYTIPTINGEPAEQEIVIVGNAGAGSWLQNSVGEGIKGWQIPDPTNNIKHEEFLTSELQPWIDAGINFLGFDVGVGMFNYENGGTLTYGSSSADRTAVGNYKQWLLNKWPQLKTVICEAIPMDFEEPILNEFNQIVSSTNYPRKMMYKIDPNIEVCKGQLVSDVQANENIYNRIYTDSCWENKGRERFRKLNPEGKLSANTTDLSYAPKAYQYSAYIGTVSGYLNPSEWNISLENPQNNWNSWAGVDPNKMLCWYKKNTEIGAFFEDFYLLSPSLLEKYRQYFPSDKDPQTNWQKYTNIWELTPAWHDAGQITYTTKPTGLQDYDGRNYQRDDDYYNKIRNEMFLAIKNYIDRGYVFWSSINKNSFQLLKDAHADAIKYIKFKEINTSVYSEDVTPGLLSASINNLSITPNNIPMKNVLNYGFIETEETTDTEE